MTATFCMKKKFLRHLSLKLHNGQDKIALLLVKFNCSVLSSGKINCSIFSSGKINCSVLSSGKINCSVLSSGKINCSVLSSGKTNCSVLSSGKISQKNLHAYLQIIHRKKFLVIFK